MQKTCLQVKSVFVFAFKEYSKSDKFCKFGSLKKHNFESSDNLSCDGILMKSQFAFMLALKLRKVLLLFG